MTTRFKALVLGQKDKATTAVIKGEKDAFRLRQGGWRAVYRIDRAARSMHVRLIEPRSEGTYR